MKKYQTVQEYLQDQPKETRKLLNAMRNIIRETAPKAKEGIGYNIIAYHLNGPLVYIAGFKNHVSLFPTASSFFVTFPKEIKKYQTSKATLQFSLNEKIPLLLIKKIVKFRINETLK